MGRHLKHLCSTFSVTRRRANSLLFLAFLQTQVCLAIDPKLFGSGAEQSAPHSLQVGSARLLVKFEGPMPDLGQDAIDEHIRKAAQAVAVYYGHFPVAQANILVQIAAGRNGMLQGTTWGDVDGSPAVTRLRLGQRTTQQELDRDWVATHELVHMALASLPDGQQWLEEGIATYVEPIARVQAGQLPAERIWTDMASGMAHGEPEPGDRGLNRTHTWGRTYWGGALFCLVADIEIRKQTGNTRGLQDALRAIVNARGTIDKDWSVGRLLETGEKATGTSVLKQLYAAWSIAPVEVDLSDLWKQLGVHLEDGSVSFDEAAPLAKIRVGITATPRP